MRELQEEIRLTERDLDGLALRFITLCLKHGEVRQNYYFFASLAEGSHVHLYCEEGLPEWIFLRHLMDLEMPFTSKCVLAHYLQTGKNTAFLYGGIAEKNGIDFGILNEFP